MISGLCGFADLVRRQGGEVGAAELINTARAFALIDLADRRAVERSLRLCLNWATEQPDAFGEAFAAWFNGGGFDVGDEDFADEGNAGDLVSVGLDAETVDAARIHTDEATGIEDRGDDAEQADGATADDGVRGTSSAPGAPDTDGGTPVAAHGDLAAARPAEETGELERRTVDVVVALPDVPPDATLELARSALADAIELRRPDAVLRMSRSRVTALTDPLSRDERDRLIRCARSLDRQLRGAPSWRRKTAPAGLVDLRRTLRHMVTTGGFPVDVRHVGRRSDAARLVVLVDVSLSVRGTSRLVLHLVHRLRSSVGSLRAFGFVDAFVPIDRALRTDDPVRAIEGVLGMVDVQASSDPGRAMRSWWSRWHYLVSPETHVMILSDGRCNGRDPAFDTVRRITQQSASTTWISPEPPGAWRLGRAEMAEYATCVDRAITVRSIDDLQSLVGAAERGSRRRSGGAPRLDDADGRFGQVGDRLR
ncbi:MAG: VWA domain-containing protein [Actinomycetota bacterium]